uniref:Uncharacterized protein n=1 Tax=Arundo donax TaxID=35708 RepID=A0A0A9GQR5_ARUDO
MLTIKSSVSTIKSFIVFPYSFPLSVYPLLLLGFVLIMFVA